MELLAIFAVMGALGAVAVGIQLIARRFSGSARRRRQLAECPIVSIAAAHTDRLVRVRGVVRSDGPTLMLPFSGKLGVFHVTQVVDTANPHETSTFNKSGRAGFYLDDGTGQARIANGVQLELFGREPESGGLERGEPALAEFMGEALERLFSKGGWVLWRQVAIHPGDEIVVFAVMQQGLVLAPPESGGVVVIELKTPTRAG
jgi:hypothetical protein